MNKITTSPKPCYTKILMKFLLLSSCTIGAWLIHAGLLQIYAGRFASTKNLAFRTAHILEISLTFGVTLLILLKFNEVSLSSAKALVVVLATLGLIDAVAFIALPNLRQTFDIWHFIAAYLAVSAIVLITFTQQD